MLAQNMTNRLNTSDCAKTLTALKIFLPFADMLRMFESDEEFTSHDSCSNAAAYSILYRHNHLDTGG